MIPCTIVRCNRHIGLNYQFEMSELCAVSFLSIYDHNGQDKSIGSFSNSLDIVVISLMVAMFYPLQLS